jgi:predicted Rossmann fold flavoprotein
VPRTLTFFDELGVRLHEEEHGKMFPDSNRARDVLEALLVESDRRGVERVDGCRVMAIDHADEGFVAGTSRGPLRASSIVLATGGQSLPKSGSDGAGYELARRLGHTIVPPVPALVPLMLGESALRHATLAGVSHECEIGVWCNNRVDTRVSGALLWTHFGISGPAALDVSRHWTRGEADGRPVDLVLNVCPGDSFETMDSKLVDLFDARPRSSLQTVLSTFLPDAVGRALLTGLAISPAQVCATASRDLRRRLARALVEWHLPVIGTRGYNYAEVTAGGVAMSEVDPGTLESRMRPGLFFAGEILDVDGRLGGFNFQWAWSSGHAVATALAARHRQLKMR